jgi:nucleoside-diphosphate-sugar epimerase
MFDRSLHFTNGYNNSRLRYSCKPYNPHLCTVIIKIKNMRVFVTGATGFVGSAVVKELINAGHDVLGLARNENAAKLLTAAGAQVHTGNLEDLESLKAGAAQADGVIHTGFIHDFTRYKECCETDRRAIMALGEALAGTNKPLVVTSGTALLTSGKLAIETDARAADNPNPRLTEEAADAVAALGVKVSVVRLPPSVHGEGDHGFVPILINIARQKGISVYKGDGSNLWPAVHRTDAAKVFRLALEKNAEGGTRYHAVTEEGIAFKEIAEVIGKRLNLPVKSKTPTEADTHFDWFAHFAAFNNPTSSKQTQEQLNWNPVNIGLIEDVDSDYYFNA